MNEAFWSGKSVFVTGHTGFKGGWLAHWLASMGAAVHGFALAPPTRPSFFESTHLSDRLASHTIGDIRDFDALLSAMQQAGPSIVLHLAAQPLVMQSYRAPIETYATNVLGTVHLLEAARCVVGITAIVNVTTDKCYENREWIWPYRETERLGGYDPYSSSKACAELVSNAYRRSFLDAQGIELATARAGNVLGGGDWAANRLIPDFLRAIDAGETLVIRSPTAVRPWQHVLEPLAGYLTLAEHLADDSRECSAAYNFGPDDADTKTVQWIVEHLCEQTAGATWRLDDRLAPHEAHQLRLDSSLAKQQLGWQPRWSLESALEMTLQWHQAWRAGENVAAITDQQIEHYCSLVA